VNRETTRLVARCNAPGTARSAPIARADGYCASFHSQRRQIEMQRRVVEHFASARRRASRRNSGAAQSAAVAAPAARRRTETGRG
jgi:hypothetical protein